MVNIRTKGAEAEREVIRMLNDIDDKVRAELELPVLATKDKHFQRNPKQAAVGGHDIDCPFALGFEIKRQEQLSINTWWKQCVASAERCGGRPILMFRQSKQKWRVMTTGFVPMPNGRMVGPVRLEIDLDTFKSWMYVWIKTEYESGSVTN